MGRFQPPQMTDLLAIRKALSLGRQVVLLLMGHRLARTPKNPWTSEERQTMVEACLTPEERARIHFVPVQDWLYNASLWVESVQRGVHAIVPEGFSVAVLESTKDERRTCLDLFPEWARVEFQGGDGTDGSELRGRYFTDPRSLDLEETLPRPVRAWLRSWESTDLYQGLLEEYRYILDYRARWSVAPYAVNFVTADAVVVKAGHVLLVERKRHPGKGLFALPGGFLDTQETLLQAALRELQEETHLQVSEGELLQALEAEKVFDDPVRSIRGRTLTCAFYFNLGPGPLPEIEAADDAARAFWLPLSEVGVSAERFFDDHKDVIGYFTDRSGPC